MGLISFNGILMKNTIYIICAIGITLLACSTMKNTAGSSQDLQQLTGTWQLSYISGPRIAFEGLYPDKKPTLMFDVKAKRISGQTSCNSFSGALVADDGKIDFTGPIMMTKMYCPGAGEPTFLETLKKVTSYSVADDSVLNLIMGDITLMRFTKLSN